MLKEIFNLVMDLLFFAWPLAALYVIAIIFQIAERYEKN
jgi:hypothetical protein